ncbi:LutC/YkgG family protein [Salinithrix halophila]|uniref:Lactate utilization protein C n=1 Tax=Salinithrix halophila TaxID=1485204 RepID=A0ABV8JJB9_9BACL
MTDTDKSQFIARLSERLGRPLPTAVAPPEWENHPWDDLNDGHDREDVIRQFIDNLSAAGGEAVRVPDRAALKEQIHRDLVEKDLRKLVLWEEENLASLIREADLSEVTLWDSKSEAEALITRAERADAGLVEAEWGLAFSGTVLLWNEQGRGRSVSLLPSHCLVVLSEDRIVPRMEPALSWIRDQRDVPACVNFISGPSRTSDIENDLSIGVHGPGFLRVYIVGEE